MRNVPSHGSAITAGEVFCLMCQMNAQLALPGQSLNVCAYHSEYILIVSKCSTN